MTVQQLPPNPQPGTEDFDEILVGTAADSEVTTGEQMVIDLGGGRMLRGLGPFQRAAQASEDGWAFYRNDFSLSDPRPWHIPQRIEWLATLPPRDPDSLGLVWEQPAKEDFKGVFEDVMQRIGTGQLRKAVPAVTARADWTMRQELQFVRQLAHLGGEAGTHGYAYRSGDGSGFAGQTPEVLFRLDGGVLQTMALAGTVPSAEADAMLANPKLLREHELVVEMLRERLAALGELAVAPRELFPLGAMTHLCTKMQVVLDDPRKPGLSDSLVRLLHPTPALGIAPRTVANMELLQGYRSKLGVPEMFGAPFGIHWPQGMLMLVAIRGIFWEKGRVKLPAGVGLVAGSRMELEWEELELKRSWVQHALRV